MDITEVRVALIRLGHLKSTVSQILSGLSGPFSDSMESVSNAEPPVRFEGVKNSGGKRRVMIPKMLTSSSNNILQHRGKRAACCVFTFMQRADSSRNLDAGGVPQRQLVRKYGCSVCKPQEILKGGEVRSKPLIRTTDFSFRGLGPPGP